MNRAHPPLTAAARIHAHAAPAVSSPEDVADALEARSLGSWDDLAKAVQARIGEALADAAARLEPAIQHVAIPARTLRDASDVRAWVAEVEAELLAKVELGPVRPRF